MLSENYRVCSLARVVSLCMGLVGDRGRNRERGEMVQGLEWLGHKVGFRSRGCEEPLKSEGKTNKLLEDSEQKNKVFSHTKYNCSCRDSIQDHVVGRGRFTLP